MAEMLEFEPGRPWPLGATPGPDGVNFAVFSEHAEAVEICLFDATGRREIARAALPEKSGAIWHGLAPDLGEGAIYGLRARGPYAPESGHRFNPAKLLLDPYAKALAGEFGAPAALLGADPSKGDDVPDRRDSAGHMPKAVVTAPAADWGDDAPPDVPWEETVIYEAHVKGLTRRHPGVPEHLRGTYEALACDAMLDHYAELGVTAVELLPIHAFLDDSFLLDKGLTQYWGYNTACFFAPEPRYFGPEGAAGLRKTIRRLHGEGIEVILDVVYNHTAEGDQNGPTLSFRGLDNASYYRLHAGQPRWFVNDTGCGNTVNVMHPAVLRLVLDSLRWWVEEWHVDGFRFDLATVLGREAHGFDPAGGFFDAIRQDPVLSRVKLIAEPWDIGPGGYQLGGYPPEFSEWNDAARDSVRRFWMGEPHGAQDLAGRLLGSAGTFDRAGRRPRASINFVAAHDGFTLADTAAFGERRNEANGEGGADGHHANFSDGCGADGPTDDPKILARRARRRRNLLATVFLSQGAPMLLAGDEIGNSQGGNNNAYCQDNEIAWIDWPGSDLDMLTFTRRLTALRRAHPALRQSRFLHGGRRAEDGAPDVEWRGLDGRALNWRDPGLRGFAVVLRCAAETPALQRFGDQIVIAFNGTEKLMPFVTPPAPAGGRWRRVLDTSDPTGAPGSGPAIAADAICVWSLELSA